MNRTEIIQQLRQEANRILNAASILEGTTTTNNRPTLVANPTKRLMSESARKRISDAQKKRWAKVKRAA